ncbi:MAG TPA: hypothetical protein VH087_07205 [Thermoanaerobaculia bacterium]|nr:hypothetical protein [Thermoanaerobaculia bacterium]
MIEAVGARLKNVHDLPSEHPEHLHLNRLKVAHHAVEHGERANVETGGVDQRDAGSETDIGRAGNKWVLCKRGVLRCIGKKRHIASFREARGKRRRHWQRIDFPAERRFHFLIVAVDEPKERDRRVADMRSLSRECLQLTVVLADRAQISIHPIELRLRELDWTG